MTNRTIDQDARVILAAVAGLRYAAVRADPDAARKRILHALTSTHRPVARDEALFTRE